MKRMLPLAEPLIQSVLSPLPPVRPVLALAAGLRGDLPEWTRRLLGSVEALGLDLFDGEMVEHPAARALMGYLLVRGGVHQVAYARALENLTGADMMKLFPSPRIPTEKIPECQPHIKRGEHLKLYCFSPNDFQELAAVSTGRTQKPVSH